MNLKAVDEIFNVLTSIDEMPIQYYSNEKGSSLVDKEAGGETAYGAKSRLESAERGVHGVGLKTVGDVANVRHSGVRGGELAARPAAHQTRVLRKALHVAPHHGLVESANVAQEARPPLPKVYWSWTGKLWAGRRGEVKEL